MTAIGTILPALTTAEPSLDAGAPATTSPDAALFQALFASVVAPVAGDAVATVTQETPAPEAMVAALAAGVQAASKGVALRAPAAPLVLNIVVAPVAAEIVVADPDASSAVDADIDVADGSDADDAPVGPDVPVLVAPAPVVVPRPQPVVAPALPSLTPAPVIVADAKVEHAEVEPVACDLPQADAAIVPTRVAVEVAPAPAALPRHVARPTQSAPPINELAPAAPHVDAPPAAVKDASPRVEVDADGTKEAPSSDVVDAGPQLARVAAQPEEAAPVLRASAPAPHASAPKPPVVAQSPAMPPRLADDPTVEPAVPVRDEDAPVADKVAETAPAVPVVVADAPARPIDNAPVSPVAAAPVARDPAPVAEDAPSDDIPPPRHAPPMQPIEPRAPRVATVAQPDAPRAAPPVADAPVAQEVRAGTHVPVVSLDRPASETTDIADAPADGDMPPLPRPAPKFEQPAPRSIAPRAETNVSEPATPGPARSGAEPIRDVLRAGVREIAVETRATEQPMATSTQPPVLAPADAAEAARAAPMQHAVASQAEASSPERRAQVAEIRFRALERQIIAAARDGTDTIRMQLYPPGLGQIVIRLAMDGKNLRLSTKAATEDGATALREAEAGLRDALAGGGFDLTHFDVSDESGERRQDRRETPDAKIPTAATSEDFAIDMNA